MKRKLGPSTTAIHGQPARRTDWTPVVAPLYQSSTFTNPVGSGEEVMYSRYGNNPNQLTLAARYAELEGAEAAIFVASGMAATALAHLAVLRPGDHLLASSWIYGGTRRLFEEEFGRFGIEVSYVQPDQPRQWRRMVRKSTRAIFVETPTNPTMRILPDAHTDRARRGFALLVIATVSVNSPARARRRHRHHQRQPGVPECRRDRAGHRLLVEEVTRLMLWGQAIDPHAAWLVERGMRTLGIRMERHNVNGMAVARWAEGREEFTKVHYPGLPSHPEHALAAQLMEGFGGMVGLELKGGAKAAERFLRRLKLVTHAPSLAGVESLISEPRLTSHRRLSEEQRGKAGIPDGFLRLSCGIEDAEDIIADLEQALG